MSAQLSPEAAVLLDMAERERRRRDPVCVAKHGMHRTGDVIDATCHDPVLTADARTSMCDYRIALSHAMGRTCDRNGYSR